MHDFLIALLAGVTSGMSMNLLDRAIWYRKEFKAILEATREKVMEK